MDFKGLPLQGVTIRVVCRIPITSKIISTKVVPLSEVNNFCTGRHKGPCALVAKACMAIKRPSNAQGSAKGPLEKSFKAVLQFSNATRLVILRHQLHEHPLTFPKVVKGKFLDMEVIGKVSKWCVKMVPKGQSSCGMVWNTLLCYVRLERLL